MQILLYYSNKNSKIHYKIKCNLHSKQFTLIYLLYDQKIFNDFQL